MSTGPPQTSPVRESVSNGMNELLIVSVTPQNLERGILWFKENFSSLKKARISNPWWRGNSLIIEKDLQLQPSQLARNLIDMGYERTEIPRGKGAFSVRGGIIEVWPINDDIPHLIEFRGNTVLEISPSPPREEKIKPRIVSQSVEKLPEGSYVVHADHGIGIFRGVSSENEFSISNSQFSSESKLPKTEFYIIEYASPATGIPPDKLLVPTDQKDRISPYIGFETPRIHRLGGTLWQNTKRKIKEDAKKLARELMSLYAQRETTTRPPYEGDKILEEEIRRTFKFSETDSQLNAEKDIMRDLSRSRPMDRILCGDVGFGKTEIALRAASRVMSSGRQVALLAPTTVLAAQHAKTFKERADKMPFKIEMLSRLTTRQEEKRIVKEIREGTVDCVIGTHRLLSQDIIFQNPGLVIIDEEQRFGVKQKERFREMRSDVDVLSLSATPIPRTLSMALARIRDISHIRTPPPERKPIQTFVLPYSTNTIKKAAQFELERGGQIYFLHNRIETIHKIREKIIKMLKYKEVGLPKGRPNSMNFAVRQSIGIIHGRMKEKEIVLVMDQFRNGEIKILLATTIIENGIDISSANTLIVDDATRLGLADAHQLRGRIGRGATQAHAYFLYHPRHLTAKSLERLEALQDYADLGAGYQIALRDLEIRGAGNIFGREQSGAVNKVGLNLYCQILSDAVERLQNSSVGTEDEPSETQEPFAQKCK